MIFKKYKIKAWAFALWTVVYLLIAHSVIDLMTVHFIGKQIHQVRDEVQHELDLVRYSMEANIYRDIYRAESFALVVSLDPQFALDNWNTMVEQFLSKSNLVRSLGLAPNDIISHVYPLEGNEKAIGLDLRTIPSQYQTVQRAKQQKQVFIDGPLELVEGGKGLIARYPIFTDIPQHEEYWGGFSVVIEYDKLIEQSRLSSVEGATIALTGYDNDQLIEGDDKVLSDYDVSYPIYLPSGNWNLFAKYTDINQIESIHQSDTLFRALGWATFSVFYVLILGLIKNYVLTHNLSLHDELTKLPNRRFLFNELNRVMSRSNAAVHLTILSIDINKFKAINDSLGHEAGDAVMRHVALLLTQSLRSSDFISRVGGDEFIVILRRSTNLNDVRRVIKTIHHNVKQNVFRWDEHDIPLSLSIGHYRYNGRADASKINEILSKADKSMYVAKRNHKLVE